MNRRLRWVVLIYSLTGMSWLASTPVLSQEQNARPEVQTNAGSAILDISGTWVAKMTTPMGEMEITYKLKVNDGKITGTQSLPFGDSPIVDGRVSGDTFRFVVELESFGNIQKREVQGKIVGDTLELIPALPAPPPGMGPGAEGPGGPPSGGPPSGGPPEPGAAGAPGGAAPPFQIQTVVARRGTPTPTYRAPSVDYAALPHLALPALRSVPSVGVANTPPMGWNSWNKFQTKIDDATVRGIADAMVSSGMKNAGYRYVIIDDGWQGSRDAKGVLSPNPQFPDMKALADYVHSKGLLIGIYSSPGPRTCGGFEGSYGHEEQDAKTFAAWGMDYLKYDWCSASRIWKDADMQAVYQRMGEALKQTGRPIVYALCQYGRSGVVQWGSQVGANLWRTTSDISDRYASMAEIGFTQSDLADFAGPGHWNDPDMLEVGNGGMSTDEYRTHFILWAMIAAPLIAGNDIRNMSPEIAAIFQNSEVIAVDQDSLGAGGKRVSRTGEIEIWQKPLASGDIAIAIFNHSAKEMRSVVSWETLSIGKDYAVRDLWAHADRGTTAEAFSEPVSAHGAIVLRLHRIE